MMETDFTFILLFFIMILSITSIVISIIVIIQLRKGENKKNRLIRRRYSSLYASLLRARKREKLDFLLVTNLNKSLMLKNVVSIRDGQIVGIIHDPKKDPRQQSNISSSNRNRTAERDQDIEQAVPFQVPLNFWECILNYNGIGLCIGDYIPPVEFIEGEWKPLIDDEEISQPLIQQQLKAIAIDSDNDIQSNDQIITTFKKHSMIRSESNPRSRGSNTIRFRIRPGKIIPFFKSEDIAIIKSAEKYLETLTMIHSQDIKSKYDLLGETMKLTADRIGEMNKNAETSAVQLGRLAFFHQVLIDKFIEGILHESETQKPANIIKEKIDRKLEKLREITENTEEE